MYGYSSEEIVGRSIDLLIPEDRRGETALILAEIGAGQHVAEIETVRFRKDGTAIPVSVTVSPICDPTGTVVATSAVHHDMTAHLLKLETAQRLAAIVENSTDAIVGRTLDGTITSWNPAAGRMFGYSSKEMVGKPVGLLIAEDRAGEVVSILAEISAGKSVTNYETCRLRKDGTPITVSLTTSPHLTEQGAVVGASEIYRDMTARPVRRAAGP